MKLSNDLCSLWSTLEKKFYSIRKGEKRKTVSFFKSIKRENVIVSNNRLTLTVSNIFGAGIMRAA
jgi:hypothetical protein